MNEVGGDDCKTTYEEKAICLVNKTMEECYVVFEKENEGTIEQSKKACNNYKGNNI